MRFDFDPFRDGFDFQNYSLAAAPPWSVFRRTFLGIGPSQGAASPLDSLFYTSVYSDPHTKGQCAGMAATAMAIRRYGGFRGFCGPANVYLPGPASPKGPPANADLALTLAILMGRQFNQITVARFLDHFASGKARNAGFAFDAVEVGLASHDPCALSIAQDMNGKEGHVVVPYGLTRGSTSSLYVYDPNFPPHRFASYYNGGSNVITLTGATWTYAQGAGVSGVTPKTYTGDLGSGGWCLALPLSGLISRTAQPLTLGWVSAQLQFLLTSAPVTVRDAAFVPLPGGRLLARPASRRGFTVCTSGPEASLTVVEGGHATRIRVHSGADGAEVHVAAGGGVDIDRSAVAWEVTHGVG